MQPHKKLVLHHSQKHESLVEQGLTLLLWSGLNLKVVVKWKNEFNGVLCQILNY
jgi:hypothetical protein